MQRADNRGVALAWANQQAAMNSNGQYYTDGRVLYSYGPHWPLAAWVDGRPVICDEKYSVTTSKHRSFAVGGLVRTFGRPDQGDFWTEVCPARFVPTIAEMRQIVGGA